MFSFNKFVFAALFLAGGVSANKKSTTTEQILLEKVEELERRLDALSSNKKRGSLTNSGSAHRKTRGELKKEASTQSGPSNRRLGKGGKGGVDFGTGGICYQDDLVTLASFDLDETGINGDLDRASLEFGLIDVEKDHSVTIEVSATTLLAVAKGGEVADPLESSDDTSQVYIVGAGVLVYPILQYCGDFIKQCKSLKTKKTEEQVNTCVVDACRASTDPTYVRAVKPSPFLPLDVAVIGGYTSNVDGDRRLEPDVYYEILGQLELSTTTVKFFIPGDSLEDGPYLLDMAFVAAVLGTNVDLDNPELADWQLAGAVLGPHMIEVETTDTSYEVCDYGVDV